MLASACQEWLVEHRSAGPRRDQPAVSWTRPQPRYPLRDGLMKNTVLTLLCVNVALVWGMFR